MWNFGSHYTLSDSLLSLPLSLSTETMCVTTLLPCKAKGQYPLTLQISRYCLLALQTSEWRMLSWSCHSNNHGMSSRYRRWRWANIEPALVDVSYLLLGQSMADDKGDQPTTISYYRSLSRFLFLKRYQAHGNTTVRIIMVHQHLPCRQCFNCESLPQFSKWFPFTLLRFPCEK